jgi:YjbE family integral membrane protein
MAAVFNIIIIDLVLSGDNAIVIGMAVRALPPRQKRLAVISGGVGALGLRLLFTGLVTTLVGGNIPIVLAVGGLVLVWITYRLLTPESEEADATEAAGSRGFWAAMRTIIIADVTMSLDNILAVGVAARGDVLLLIIGLAFSMLIIMLGGALVSTLLGRLPWLNYVGGLILLYLAGDMIVRDPVVHPWLGHNAELAGLVLTVLFGALIGGLLVLRHQRATGQRVELERSE